MNKPTATIVNADCIEWLRSQPENSIDAIVTDPPYGIGFSAVTGKSWDDAPPGEEWARECLRVLKPGGHILAFGASRTWHRLAVAIEDGGFEIRDSIAWIYGSGMHTASHLGREDKKLEGFWSSTRPGFEPVVVGRKDVEGSIIENAQKWGTGGLNLGATMVGNEFRPARANRKPDQDDLIKLRTSIQNTPAKYGRNPTNVILGEDAAAELDELTPLTKASKFFYSPKASQSERPYVDGTIHPTVKPLNLMRYLIRLVTPPGGVVLDTFTGSGATVEAALMEGFDVIGVERDADYIPLINARIDRYNGLGNARPSDRDSGLHDIFTED